MLAGRPPRARLSSPQGRPQGSGPGAAVRVIVGNRGFLGLLGCNVLLGLSASFVAPFLSLFGEHEVGMGPSAFGAFMTATTLSGIVISTVLARWSDTRFSRRAVLLLGSAAGCLGYVGYAFVRDPAWLLAIGSILLGIAGVAFSQMFAQARELLARTEVPAEDAPLYMNIFRLTFALAWTIGPALASLIMSRYSFAGTFAAAAVCYLALFAAIFLLVSSRPPARGASRDASLRETLRALARGDVLAHFAAFVLIFACGSIASISLPLFVVETLGGTSTNVGIVYSVSPFFELPLMFLFGSLASRGHHARLIRLGAILAVVYYAVLSLVRAPWQIYPLQVVSAAIVAVTQGLAISFFQDFLPKQVGTATNLYSNASSLGRVLGFLFYAQLAAAFGYRGIFVACAAACGAAALIMWLFRPQSRPQSRPKA